MTTHEKISKLPRLEKAVQEFLETESAAAKQQMIEVGQAMIDYYSAVYSSDTVDQDLQKAAKEGFLMALKQYDATGKMTFSTYASHCIISEIRAVLQERKHFTLPAWLKELKEQVRLVSDKLTQEADQLPTLEEIAKKVSLAEEAVKAINQDNVDLFGDNSVTTADEQYTETIKAPIEDVTGIRKSLDRIHDIMKKVLDLVALNLEELSLAIKEEEHFFAREQLQHRRIVDGDHKPEHEHTHQENFTLGFPLEFADRELKGYFDVLAGEYGLHFKEMRIMGEVQSDDVLYMSVPLEVELDGRYRGLLQLLDYMRNEEKAIRIKQVRTSRNQNVPARINIIITLDAIFRKET